MEIKEGSRVRVLKLDGAEVDFYGTIVDLDTEVGTDVGLAVLIDCTDKGYNYRAIALPHHKDFGSDRYDYYELVEEEPKTTIELKKQKITVGDRVRVLKLNGNEVDFYATLATYERFPEDYVILTNCSDEVYDNELAFAPREFIEGEDRADYYELAEEHEFKVGDRVHVTRLNGTDVDFYGTLISGAFRLDSLLKLDCCSDSKFNNESVYIQDNHNFGKYKHDYYTLATDEPKEEEEDMGREIDGITVTMVNGEDLYFFGGNVKEEALDELETDLLMYLKGLTKEKVITVELNRPGYTVIKGNQITSVRVHYKN